MVVSYIRVEYILIMLKSYVGVTLNSYSTASQLVAKFNCKYFVGECPKGMHSLFLFFTSSFFSFAETNMKKQNSC
jgi:hypothetical protein